METVIEQPFVRLRRLNIIMGIAHLVQGILMLVISSNFWLPITTSFLTMDPVTDRLVANPETWVQVRIGPMVAVFLLMSSLAHFAVASPWGFPWYVKNLRKGANYARWIEYSFSASLMIVVIAMLVGVFDIGALILIFGLNAMMVLFGWMMELHNQTTPKTDWASFLFGTIAGIIPWVVIAIYLFGSGDENGGPPGFVYGIFASIFVFFNVFAVNMVLQYRKIGRWRDYLYGERAYVWLSLVAKSALAWQVFGGTFRGV
jgi:hypothetical protein